MKSNLAIIESDSVIASMTRASFALAEAVSVSQTKIIIDVARAAEIYAKRQHLSESAISQATSVKVEAMRKLGEILMDTPKNQGAKGSAVPNRNRANLDETPTLDELGLTKKESAIAQKLAGLSDEAFEQVREGSVTIAKALAAVKTEKEKPAVAKRDQKFYVDVKSLITKPDDVTPVVEPEPEAPVDYTELDSANDQISELQSDLVIARMGNATDEEKQQAAALIAELRAEIKTLTATLASANNSRDSLMEENTQMKVQMQMQRKEIAKLKNSK